MNLKLFKIFGILGMGILEKMNPELCEFLETLGMGILEKNEFGDSVNFGYENFKK